MIKENQSYLNKSLLYGSFQPSIKDFFGRRKEIILPKEEEKMLFQETLSEKENKWLVNSQINYKKPTLECFFPSSNPLFNQKVSSKPTAKEEEKNYEKSNKIIYLRKKRKFKRINPKRIKRIKQSSEAGQTGTLDSKKHFIKIKYPNSKRKFTNTTSLMTYNILNQKLIKRNDIGCFQITSRMIKVINEIKELNPDIFCLQEADLDVYSYYLINNQDLEDYKLLYGANCGSSFINITGYKKEKFFLKSFQNFHLLSLGKTAGNRGILATHLMDKDENNFCIYNVHYPIRYEKDRIRMHQFISAHIQENFLSLEEAKKTKLFILGDFNSYPNSKVINMLNYDNFLGKLKDINLDPRCVDYESLRLFDKIYEKFKFKNAYEKHKRITLKTFNYKGVVDYIFYSSKSARLKSIMKLPNLNLLAKDNFLPNENYPSDHLDLYAEFEY